MSSLRNRKRIPPPSVGWATIFSTIGFFFLAAGGLVVYFVFRDIFINQSTINWFILGFSGVLFLIGWLSMKSSQKNAQNLLDFESASTITTTTVGDHGRVPRRDSYGDIYYVYWISFQIQPHEKVAIPGDFLLRADVKEKLYNRFAIGDSLRVRYAHSNPCIAEIEGETRNIDRSFNPRDLVIYWIIANVIGGVVGYYIGLKINPAAPLLFGAIFGLVLAEAQWIILHRLIPIPNWVWVATSIIGWAAFVRLSFVYQGVIGSAILGFLQWVLLRQKHEHVEMWIPFSIMGTMFGIFVFNTLIPFTPILLVAAAFYLLYSVCTGFGLFLIKRETVETSEIW